MTDIKLIEPENGSITAPLQKYDLPQLNDRKDRSLPQAVSFIWEAYPDVTYDLLISPNPDFKDSRHITALSEPRAEVLHLHVATRYFWKVMAKRAGQFLTESPTWSFTTNRATPRWMHIPGTTNVRDIGGWPLPNNCMVRQGVFYRSSQMNGAVQITAEGQKLLEQDLGIRTDLDFRGPVENPYPVLDEDKVQWINVPINAYSHISNEEGQEGYRKIFEIFADASNHPILYHCWGGADRAGTVSFLLNALLGVEIENITRDYELTSLSIWGERSRESKEFKGLIDALAPFGDGTGSFATKAESYLLSIGVTPGMIATIREHLVVGQNY